MTLVDKIINWSELSVDYFNIKANKYNDADKYYYEITVNTKFDSAEDATFFIKELLKKIGSKHNEI